MKIGEPMKNFIDRGFTYPLDNGGYPYKLLKDYEYQSIDHRR